MSDALQRQLHRFSREMRFSVDTDGALTALDPRARRYLRSDIGTALRKLAPSGSEGKVAEFLARARVGEVTGWELPLCVEGRPAVVSCSAVPSATGIDILGSLIPDDHGAALARVGQTMDEVVELNREIARQNRELEQRNAELIRLHAELDESHRGVVALHAEIEDKNESLAESSEIKTRMVANVSHELRTPIHSILGLSRLLLDGSDGALNSEQLLQVGLIRSAAAELSQLVSDLLDLSKIDSGTVRLQVEQLDLADFLLSLRGMMRPLVADSAVEMVFEEPETVLELRTDRGKLAQILRNLISNALKFTSKGEVRVGARGSADGELTVWVRDSGIGIGIADQQRIFEEFVQLDTARHREVPGTGLGLSLSRQLAHLLGGDITVQSELGRGSTFTVTVPAVHPEVRAVDELQERGQFPEPGRAPVLVLEDNRKTMLVYERFLRMAGFQVLPARTVAEAEGLLRRRRPAAVVLDIMLEQDTSWRFLSQLKADVSTRDIPVLVVTVTNRERRARALGADEFWLKPFDQDHLIRKLAALVHKGHRAKVLYIDDDPTARYLFRKHLEGTSYDVIEAGDGELGVRLARDERPGVIFLDFLLEDVTAFDVLDELKADPITRSTPVIICTAQELEPAQRAQLELSTEGVLSKEALSRELAIHRIRDALGKAGLLPGMVEEEAG